MTADRWNDRALGFVRALGDGDFAAAGGLVSGAVPADAMSPPRLEQLWTGLTAQLGALAQLTPGESAVERGRHVANIGARFARSEVTLRVVLDDDAAVAGFWVSAPRPPAYDAPSYVDSSTFHEVELTVGRAPALPAVLTLPRDGGPAAVVVLVHGSGPNDRDETVGGNRPFRDLAWGLASRGIAVLRYDKRSYASPASLGEAATVEEEVIADAVAALDVARSADGVDGARVVLLGHSLGGTLAPEIVGRDGGGVAGVVLLAAGARPMVVTLDEQLAYLDSLARAAGQPTAELDGARALVRQLAARTLPPDVNVLGAPARYVYDLDDRRPLDLARRLTVPVLVLHGGRDYQVTAEDVALWRDALADNPSAIIREFPALDHLFMPGEGRATPAAYTYTSGHVAQDVIDEIARWIRTLE
ncbi:MAG: alpha/beta hydrolase [Gemmatimonadaceae bacterium]